MTKNRNKAWIVITLCFVVFLDFVSYGMIFPVITPIFLDPKLSFLPVDTAENVRTLIFGIVSSAYPIAQFFGAPVIGGFSDRVGRKKMLTLTLFGSALANFAFVLGLIFHSALIMVVGRAIGGFMGGNAALANSMIGDVSEENEKAKNYGFIGLAMGFGVVIGPFLGGRLTDPNFINGANQNTPFYFSTFLSLLAVISVVAFCKETLQHESIHKISAFDGIKKVLKSFQQSNLRIVYLMTFLVYFAFNVFIYSLNIYLFKRIGFQEIELGNYYAYAGIWLVIGLGVINTFIVKRLDSIQVLKYSLLGLSLCFFVSVIPKSYVGIYILTPFIALMYGLSLANINALLSNTADKKQQGEAFGVNQSLQSLIEAVTPLFSSVLLTINLLLPSFLSYTLPNILAGLVVLICWIFFLRHYIMNKSK